VFNPRRLIARAADLLGKAFLVHQRVSPLEAVLAGILPLIGITGDIAFDGAEAVVGPVIIATMLLPYLVPPLLVRQIRAEGNEPAVSTRQDCFSAATRSLLFRFLIRTRYLLLEDVKTAVSVAVWKHQA
jgi:hypothetical protein